MLFAFWSLKKIYKDLSKRTWRPLELWSSRAPFRPARSCPKGPLLSVMLFDQKVHTTIYSGQNIL